MLHLSCLWNKINKIYKVRSQKFLGWVLTLWIYLWVPRRYRLLCLRQHWLWGSDGSVPVKHFWTALNLCLKSRLCQLCDLAPKLLQWSKFLLQVPPQPHCGRKFKCKPEHPGFAFFFPFQPQLNCFHAREQCIGQVIYMDSRRLEDRLSLSHFRSQQQKDFFLFFLNKNLERKRNVKSLARQQSFQKQACEHEGSHSNTFLSKEFLISF